MKDPHVADRSFFHASFSILADEEAFSFSLDHGWMNSQHNPITNRSTRIAHGSLVLDGRDRTKALFIEYLLNLFEMNRRGGSTTVYIVRRQMEVIAYALRMGALLM